MKLNPIIGSWLAAAVLLAAGIALVLRYEPVGELSFNHEEVAVVGSSLMRNGVPPHGSGPTSLLGDGRSFRRIGVSDISEEQSLSLAREAIEGGARLVFLEVNPFIRTFDTWPRKSSCNEWRATVSVSAKYQLRRLVYATRAILGYTTATEAEEQRFALVAPIKLDADAIADIYPFQFHEPYCRRQFGELVDFARQKDARIVMVLPPRSESGEGYLGKAQAQELKVRARRLSVDAGLPLFEPPGPWPDAEFADQAHMNPFGRAHFLRELRQWWQTQS